MKRFLAKFISNIGFLMFGFMLTCSSENDKVQMMIFLTGFAGLGLICLSCYMSDECEIEAKN